MISYILAQNNIGGSNGVLNFHTPILTREEILFVQPGINPAFGVESLIEFAHDGLVLRRVAEENAEFSLHGEGASHLSKRDSVSGLILSVKRELSTGQVRRTRGQDESSLRR